MMTTARATKTLAGLLCAAFWLSATTPAGAVLIGNELSERTSAGDGAANLLYSNFYAMPAAGTVDAVEVYYQSSPYGTTFEMFQLRPTGTSGNDYTVVYRSGTIDAAGGTDSAVNSLAFPNGATTVEEGDIFAHLGRGIPYTQNFTDPGHNNPPIIYPSGAVPAVNTTITLPTASYPIDLTRPRDYAWSIDLQGTKVLEQVGHGAANRGSVDGDSGVLSILSDHGFTTVGTLDQWQFYSNSSATDRYITPLLLRETSPGNFEVTGVGTPRLNDNAGLQIYDFDVVAGSDTVGPGYFPGWWDGSLVTPNAGVAEYNAAGATLNIWFDTDGVSVGELYGTSVGQAPFGAFAREYSINFVTQVPEPATFGLAVIGLVGACLVGLRRRRRSR